MKYLTKITLLSLVSLSLIACSTNNVEKPQEQEPEIPEETVVSPDTPTALTVNGEEIKLSDEEFLEVGDIINFDTKLIKPVPTFDAMEEIDLNSFTGWKLVHTVPSLDTPVCSLQTIEIENAAKNYTDIHFITISADLPFALDRFCGDNDIKNMLVLSDYQTLNFAKANHVLMEDYQLLARSIIVVDPNNIVQYVEYATEVTNEISIKNALNFIRQNK